MDTTTNHGGARPGAGRPVADIQLNQDHARMLKQVMQVRELEYNQATASEYVMTLIKSAREPLQAEAQRQMRMKLHIHADAQRKRERGRNR